jgi:hypothetical protein
MNKVSKAVIEDDGYRWNGNWIEHPYFLVGDANDQVMTTFRARDARDEGLGLGHITESLVFETLIKRGEFMGTRTFWATHEQAMAGHQYWIMKHKVGEARKMMEQVTLEELYVPTTPRFESAYASLIESRKKMDGAARRIKELINLIGADSIYDLTRKSDYVAASRAPVTLPISGYQSDIERFIQL